MKHNQSDQPVHEAQSQCHCSQPRQRHPITGRRLYTPPRSITTAVTTLPATTIQRFARNQTLCTTLQLQNSADPMDTDATYQTTRAEVMQEHTDTVTDSPMHGTKRHRTRSQTGPHTSHLPSIRATEATQQSNPSTHNKQDAQTLASHLGKPRTSLKQRLTPRQAHSHHLPATDVLSAKPTPHPRKTWTSQP